MKSTPSSGSTNNSVVIIGRSAWRQLLAVPPDHLQTLVHFKLSVVSPARKLVLRYKVELSMVGLESESEQNTRRRRKPSGRGVSTWTRGDNRIEGSEADYKEKLELLDHECRIMYFLTFRHDHGSFSKTMIVRSLLPRGTTPGNDNFKDMRLLCMEKVKNHKQALVDGAIVSLRTVYFIRYY